MRAVKVPVPVPAPFRLTVKFGGVGGSYVLMMGFIGLANVRPVPTASVLYRENRAGVFVMGGDSRAHFQPVTVLSRTADQTAVAGLTAGSRVVVAGAGFLGDGDRVTVAPAAPVRAAAPVKN